MPPQTNKDDDPDNSYNSAQPTMPAVDMTPPQRSNPWRSFLKFSVILLVVAGLFSVIVNSQNIQDWWQLRDYNPPATVSSLATQATMTDYGRKLFYLNRPAIDDKSEFVTNCPTSTKEQSIVLGCYHSVQDGIFLLNVTDKRLDGVKQVTAAHEMLHAAYDRLGAGERKKVDDMLVAYYKNGLKDKQVKAEIELYKKTEPNDVVNEMHSVFATEVGDLPVGLEQYYGQYFTQRKRVVEYANAYRSAFTSLQDQVATYDIKLKALKSDIEAKESNLKVQLSVITVQQQQMASLRSSDPQAYNSMVDDYNALVRSYNAGVASLQSQIKQYNQIVNARNAVAIQEEQLSAALRAEVSQVK